MVIIKEPYIMVSNMTVSTWNEQSIRTILRFLDKYIIKQPSTFTFDMYKGERNLLGDEKTLTVLKQLNVSYQDYLNGNIDFCKTLINDVSQEYGLRKCGRENTNQAFTHLNISDEDFDELCKAFDSLGIASGSIIDKPIDFIVIPGALQKGVETRMDIVLKYLKEHPKFQGKILVFGSRNRLLYPFTANEEVKEAMVFDIMADMFNQSQASSISTPESIQAMLREQYKNIQKGKDALSETEITEKLSSFWKEKSGLEWPTEYQMIQRLSCKKFKFHSTELIETLKKTPHSRARATTQDEAFFVADKIQELSKQKQKHNPAFIPFIAVVTKYAYQLQTYRSRLEQQVLNFEINMLSPYKNTKDFLNHYRLRPHVKDMPEAFVRSVFVIEALDAFSRFIFSQAHRCRLTQAVEIWSKKIKER